MGTSDDDASRVPPSSSPPPPFFCQPFYSDLVSLTPLAFIFIFISFVLLPLLLLVIRMSAPSFELLFAPLLFGVVLNAMLFGVFCVLVYSYFHLHKAERGWVRYLVYYLVVMEVINTMCDIGLIYEPLISLHDNPQVTVRSPKLLAADPVVTASPETFPLPRMLRGRQTLISTPTQLFMAWRIKLITKSKALGACVAFLAFLSLTGGVSSSIGVAQSPDFSDFQHHQVPLTLWLTSTAFADLFITTFLVNFLWKHQTGFHTRTDSVADKIISFTVQTGLLTSFAAIADVTLFLIVPHTTLMFIWDFSLSKMYSICLLAALNARHEWNILLDRPRPQDLRDDKSGIIKIRKVVGPSVLIPPRALSPDARAHRTTSKACSCTNQRTSLSPRRYRVLAQRRRRAAPPSSRIRGPRSSLTRRAPTRTVPRRRRHHLHALGREIRTHDRARKLEGGAVILGALATTDGCRLCHRAARGRSHRRIRALGGLSLGG
ncbi:unnamed protein product [Mycena citricolor]|uniref:DUF6534 domain-containing protein n=1 Tax=Mycena citricolor TaxID=2018698 RepID=A0AAD2Q3D0_9AGAR|nr:unnamed protein product [Mycena citricolor]